MNDCKLCDTTAEFLHLKVILLLYMSLSEICQFDHDLIKNVQRI